MKKKRCKGGRRKKKRRKKAEEMERLHTRRFIRDEIEQGGCKR